MRWLALVVVAALAHPAASAPTPLDALLARTDAVSREIAKLRGLAFKRPIPKDVVDKTELRRRLLEMLDDPKTRRQTAADGLAMRRWGLLPLATDYQALVVELFTDQIAGYYDTDRKKLTVASSVAADPDWAEMVLAHEIQHGLQDQNFDLKKLEDLPETEGDAVAARHALVEGDGIAVMIEVVYARRGLQAAWSSPQFAGDLVKALAAGGGALDTAPIAVRESVLFPYQAGFQFVAALRRRQPWSAVDAAFRRPPRSTEQILHVDKYVADELPAAIAIDVPPVLAAAGYKVAQSTVWGELGLALFLRSHRVAQPVATAAAAGWGGDRVLLLAPDGETNPQRAIGLWRIELDTEADAVEAHEAIVKALDAAIPGASIDHADARTRWFGIDGRVSWVERRGTAIAIGHGAPAWAAARLEPELWTHARVTRR